MTTATKPTRAKAPEPVPQPHAWLKDIQQAVQVFKLPERYLQPPPPGTTLDDLLKVRSRVDPSNVGPGRLLISTLTATPLVFNSLDGSSSAEMVEGLGRGLAAKAFAGQVAGGKESNSGNKDRMADLVLDLLNRVDEALVDRLKRKPHPEWLLTSDFAPGTTFPTWEDGTGQTNPGWHIGLIDGLPVGHPLREVDPIELFDVDSNGRRVKGVCFIEQLGMIQVQGIRDRSAVPRKFYSVQVVKRWTRDLRIIQLRRRKEGVLPLDQFVETTHALERLGQPSTKPWALDKPSGSVILPEPPVGPKEWPMKVLSTLETLLHPVRAFAPPPNDVTLDDLVNVRTIFQIDETEATPNREASERFASRFVGDNRKLDLIDLVLQLLAKIDTQALAWLEESWLVGARQAAEAKGTQR